MSAINIDDTQKLLSEYSFTIESDGVSEDLACVMCRKLTLNPYQTHCGCIYCQECVDVNFKNGDKFCNGGKISCKEEIISTENNVFKSAVVKKKILKLIFHCPNQPCEFVTELTNMREHLRNCSQRLQKCPYFKIGCGDENISRDLMLEHINNNSLTHSELLLDLVQNLRNEIRENKLENLSLKEELRIKDREKDEMNERINEMNNRLNLERESLKEELNKTNDSESADRAVRVVRTWIDQLTKTIDAVNIGTNQLVAVGRATFLVEGFSIRRTSEDVILSPHFYSHTNGYKMRLRVYPGGFGDGRGTHLTVFIQVCKGEYDDLLEWPCRHAAAISVVNQTSGQPHGTPSTISYSIALDAYKYPYDKPIKGDNKSHGYTTFMSHTDLEATPGLVVKDAVLLLCVISAPP